MRRNSDREEASCERQGMTGDIAKRLAEVVGSNRVIAAREELQAYAADGLVPSAIVRPASADEAAEVVRFALAERQAIVPLGSRSKCELGTVLSHYEIALDMTSMREIAHFDAGDLTLSVDAGMPLRDLEIHLKQKGQFLPLAVPCFESATVGGTVASAIDSALRLQYGSARDFLIGAEFIDGTGYMCKSGGRVVKNVTGYDLHKLLIGSMGTLGAITRLNFKTFPLPATFGGHLAGFETAPAALSYRSAVERAGLPLANLEMFSPVVADMIRAILERSEEGSPPELGEDLWNVYCSFEGNAEVVERIERDLEKIASEVYSKHQRILKTAEDELLGGMLRESFEWLRWASPANIICRLSLPTISSETLAALSRLAESRELRAALLVRAAGIVYYAVFATSEEEEAMESLARITADTSALARTEKGHSTLLHAPLVIKSEAAGRAFNEKELALQKRVKQAFDPSTIFAPGRVVGGM
jgi:glycolate oxidase FAD binding subunit